MKVGKIDAGENLVDFGRQVEEFIEGYRRSCAEARIDYVMTDTSVPYDFMLSRYIAKRNMP